MVIVRILIALFVAIHAQIAITLPQIALPAPVLTFTTLIFASHLAHTKCIKISVAVFLAFLLAVIVQQQLIA
jgi:hypothetical protein